MSGLVYMASRDKVDADTFHSGIQYALEKLGKTKFGFERTAVSNFKSKKHEGSEVNVALLKGRCFEKDASYLSAILPGSCFGPT